jgi:septal ring factor EnvC (AmiA/AmiB activator)
VLEKQIGELGGQVAQVRREIEGHKEQAGKMETVIKAKEAEKEAMEKEMQGMQESWSQVNRQLMAKEGELQRERDLNLQL